MSLAPGSRLGPYEIVAPLGAGGMGEVWRARDTRLGREVALKTLPAEFARDPERLARFEREARSVAGLNHPNIVVLHSIEEAGGTRFLTMELVEGEGLDRAIVAGGLPVARVLELSIAIADALVAAHEKNVVHRDLKPANVMLTRDGRLKVLDFGLAKLAQVGGELAVSQAATMDAPLSQAGQVVGTVPYMAPEQIRGEASDTRTDLFALGVVVYELAAGRRPFGGSTPADVSSSILRDSPAPLTSVRAELPGDLERIVARCLEKEPRARFQTALDVSNELRRLRKMLQASGPAPASSAPAAKDTPSVAVLPFVNMSRDEENEFFSDGLAEELLNVLAKIKGLRVAARSSAFTFKGKGATVAEVGKALNVASVLEGSVRKAGNRVRIAVQLVKVADGFHLWSETYDRTLEDIFAVQDDIAQSVVKELRTALLGSEPDSNASGEAKAEVAAAAKGRGESGEAHRLYLQGRHLVNRVTPQDLERGIGFLREAVAIEPEHALAWAQLGWSLAVAGGFGVLPIHDAMAEARSATQRAFALEPDLAEAFLALGILQHWYSYDWSAAEASFRRAIELAPGNAEALRGLGALLTSRGRLEESAALLERAVQQDPLSSSAYGSLGFALWAAGRFQEAERVQRRSLELTPDGVGVHASLALTLDSQGRTEEAFAAAGRDSADWARYFSLAVLHSKHGPAEEADRNLRALIETHRQDAAVQIAIVYAVQGKADLAFEWLDRALAQRDAGISIVKTGTLLAPLHTDPRWRAFLAKVGLAD